MDSSELHEAFRSSIGADLSRLYSDDEVWRMADDAYRTFVRLTGGIPDFSSSATEVPIVSGEAVSALSPLILRITRMTLRSDKSDIKIINQTDLGMLYGDDYHRAAPVRLDDSAGPVRFGMIGMEHNKVRWIKVPEVDDFADLMIYRLPLTRINDEAQSLDEIDNTHHYALLDHMTARAMMHPEANATREGVAHGAVFADYCRQVRREIERRAFKPRVTQYGGL